MENNEFNNQEQTQQPVVNTNEQQNVQQPVSSQQPVYQQPVYQQPIYQQPPYQQPPYRQPRNPKDGKGFSITALVLGICGVALCWVGGLNLIILACGILGIVFGYLGRKKSIAAYGKASGLATAGFVLGIIGTAICALGVLACTACASCSSCSACSTAKATNDLLNNIYY